MRIFDIIFKKKERDIVYPINPEKIGDNKLIKELSQALQGRDAQLSKITAKRREEKDKKNKEEEEQEEIKKILDVEKEIKEKKYENTVFFGDFYKKFFKDKKFRTELEIVDKDDCTIFGKFGDFIIINGDEVGIVDNQKKIVIHGKTFRDIIYKPEGLKNQWKRKRICLSVDKNFKRIQDLENLEIPDVKADDMGNYRETEELQQKAKELLIYRDEIIRQKSEKVERLENSNIRLVARVRDLTRAVRVLNNKTDVSETELSKAMEKSIQFEQKVNDQQMQIVKLNNYKNLLESMKDKLETINQELLEKVEETGMKSEFRKALDTVQNLIDWAKDKIPKTYIENLPAPVRQQVQPGEPMK